ncbi:hypothetical protein KJ365_01875 [Glaciecola sp. XM2]|jgi:sulfur transfer complex TusBCD TusB component (DsrH family)|uniref:DsrH/TusB family sulfur relay protein n=1 Tax=Glaciecola sp. XM2 TaxID=1914931 RepID=UPI001BDEEE67|nr:DsrH/TusB family sulfur relay protein [Glaciecola sp. XM2]MBT1449617.1 hypothetical protein [Glaciecola sp. XM2]
MLLQVLSNQPDKVSPYFGDDDVSIVLMQDGVYMLSLLLQEVPAPRVFVLEQDWLASGLAHQRIFEGKQINLINPMQWVAMTTEHFNVVTVQ